MSMNILLKGGGVRWRPPPPPKNGHRPRMNKDRRIRLASFEWKCIQLPNDISYNTMQSELWKQCTKPRFLNYAFSKLISC